MVAHVRVCQLHSNGADDRLSSQMTSRTPIRGSRSGRIYASPAFNAMCWSIRAGVQRRDSFQVQSSACARKICNSPYSNQELQRKQHCMILFPFAQTYLYASPFSTCYKPVGTACRLEGFATSLPILSGVPIGGPCQQRWFQYAGNSSARTFSTWFTPKYLCCA